MVTVYINYWQGEEDIEVLLSRLILIFANNPIVLCQSSIVSVKGMIGGGGQLPNLDMQIFSTFIGIFSLVSHSDWPTAQHDSEDGDH